MTTDPTALLFETLSKDPATTAILLDVDGTLAPIVRDSRDASVPVPVRTALVKLARHFGLVACVSGRQAEDARRVVGAGGLSYIGGHGSEFLLPGDWEATVDPELEAWTEPVQEAAAEAIRDLSSLGIRREDKGAISALHWRGTPDENACRTALEGVAVRAEEAGLVAHWGKKVLEIRPPAAFNKGMGIRHLLADSPLQTALYIGDDVTDIDAFAELGAMVVEGWLDSATKVAVESPEAPPELLAAADFLVEGTAGVHALLERLAVGKT
ncbi:MAG: trehalose-phosphatase [Actinobacteria bacterium]|uniref:trehalose-phosphatase n=1 Tax=freshwater metagenome TaxID=449393 RepID=A0A6J7EMJ8_9ZZZZ|nr:trehalose-phosphatase [Actinomycetota bacterium]